MGGSFNASAKFFHELFIFLYVNGYRLVAALVDSARNPDARRRLTPEDSDADWRTLIRTRLTEINKTPS
jgi:hypothetical protein